MPFVPDYTAYCELPANSGKAECFGWWCEYGLPDDVTETEECNKYFDYCEKEENLDSALCTPPCEQLDDPESNPKCVDNSRRRHRR